MLSIWVCTATFAHAESNQDRAMPSADAIPTEFIQNNGQLSNIEDSLKAKILFRAQFPGFRAFFTPTSVIYIFEEFIPQKEKTQEQIRYEEMGDLVNAKAVEFDHSSTRIFRMDMEFSGANVSADIQGEHRQKHVYNYYLGHCPDGITNVSAFGQIRYKGIYPGTDIVFYATDKGLKYDIELQANADPQVIKFRYNGHKGMQLSGNALVIKTPLGEYTEHIPLAYYKETKLPFSCSFNLTDDIVSFMPEKSTSGEDIVIDPTIFWSTYYDITPSGSVVWYDNAFDGTNLFVGGYASTANITTVNPGGAYIQSNNGSNDWVILKFAGDLSLTWVTYHGGSGSDIVFPGCMVADPNNNAFYMVGRSASSTDWPLQNGGGYYDATFNGGSNDAAIVKFTASTGARVWSTFFGGSSSEMIRGCDVDPAGNFYISGEVNSTQATFPIQTWSGAYNDGLHSGSQEGFIAKFNSATTKLWTTYYGGTAFEFGGKIHYTQTGKLVLVLDGSSGTTPLLNPGGGAFFDNTFTTTTDLIIGKFNGSTGAHEWGTIMGGNENDNMNDGGITSSSTGNITLVCRSSSNAGTFPTFNPGGGAWYQANGGGSFTSHGLICEFNASGVQQWATFYGPTTANQTDFYSGDYDGQDNLFAGGRTFDASATLSKAGSYNDNTLSGSSDALLVWFNASTRAREWATYVGGTGSELFRRVHINSSGSCGSAQLYCTGFTSAEIPAAAEVDPGGGAYIDHIKNSSSASLGLIMRFDEGTAPPPGNTWTWVGGTAGSEDDWHQACNWDKASIPTTTSDVDVPGGTAFNPKIYAGNTGQCNTIVKDADNGALLTIDADGLGKLVVNLP